uniref:Uncharacterized protein n=1 Tax=Anguilla anguilla TaxID=7936 RepID=A0A0E9W7I0_ANGAN
MTRHSDPKFRNAERLKLRISIYLQIWGGFSPVCSPGFLGPER